MLEYCPIAWSIFPIRGVSSAKGLCCFGQPPRLACLKTRDWDAIGGTRTFENRKATRSVANGASGRPIFVGVKWSLVLKQRVAQRSSTACWIQDIDRRDEREREVTERKPWWVNNNLREC